MTKALGDWQLRWARQHRRSSGRLVVYGGVDLGGDVTVPHRIQFEAEVGNPGTAAAPGETVLKGLAEFRDGRFTITGLTIEGTSITGALLRTIPVQAMLVAAVLDATEVLLRDSAGEIVRDNIDDAVYYRFLDPDFWDPDVAKHGPTPKALQAVAIIYRVAYAAGDNPTNAVAQNLNLSRSTAGRWVMKARAAGYLGETEQRRARA